MNQGTVSVIVPSYNAESTIARCLDSVYAQTYGNVEVIVVNDGSSDSTLQILNKYRERHSSLVIIDQHNQGLSAARNSGIDAATGDFIFYLDSDDYLGTDEIELLVAAMDDETDMAIGGLTYVDVDSNVLRTVRAPACHLTERGYWDGVYSNEDGTSVEYVISCGKIFRSRLFGEVRFAPGKIHEDEFVLHHILKQCKRVAVVPTSQYYYVQSTDSITHRPSSKSALDAAEAFRDRNRYFFDVGYYDLFWLSLSQAKSALIESNGVCSSNSDILRWQSLKTQWDHALATGVRFFEPFNRNCLSCVAYRCFSFLFNNRNGSAV